MQFHRLVMLKLERWEALSKGGEANLLYIWCRTVSDFLRFLCVYGGIMDGKG